MMTSALSDGATIHASNGQFENVFYPVGMNPRQIFIPYILPFLPDKSFMLRLLYFYWMNNKGKGKFQFEKPHVTFPPRRYE